MFEINEIIALGIAAGIVLIMVFYESVAHRIARDKIREARQAAASWKALYLAIAEERDCLQHRLDSKDCQKILCAQEKLDAAREEIDRLRNLNETYKRQLDRKGKGRGKEETNG